MDPFLTKSSGRFKIAYIGTLASEGRLLREIVEDAGKHPDIELHVGGLGPLEDFLKGAAVASPNVTFYGHLPNEAALRLQNDCDMLFATYDPKVRINALAAPLKLYEAMALKKPIVVCRGTTADKVVESNAMGLAIGYDSSEFWNAASKLAEDKELCARMGENGFAAYNEKYSWTIMKKRLTQLYSEITRST